MKDILNVIPSPAPVDTNVIPSPAPVDTKVIPSPAPVDTKVAVRVYPDLCHKPVFLREP
jgi:hypothetical protein